jgi:hypothetical protein
MAAFSKSIKDKIACVLHDEMEIHTMNDIVEYCNEYLPREHQYSIRIMEYQHGLRVENRYYRDASKYFGTI